MNFMNIESYFITEEKKNSKLELRKLLHNGNLDTLKYVFILNKRKIEKNDPMTCETTLPKATPVVP